MTRVLITNSAILYVSVWLERGFIKRQVLQCSWTPADRGEWHLLSSINTWHSLNRAHWDYCWKLDFYLLISFFHFLLSSVKLFQNQQVEVKGYFQFLFSDLWCMSKHWNHIVRKVKLHEQWEKPILSNAWCTLKPWSCEMKRSLMDIFCLDGWFLDCGALSLGPPFPVSFAWLPPRAVMSLDSSPATCCFTQTATEHCWSPSPAPSAMCTHLTKNSIPHPECNSHFWSLT